LRRRRNSQVSMRDTRPRTALYRQYRGCRLFGLSLPAFASELGDERRGSGSQRCRPSVDQQRAAVGRPSSKSAKIAKRARAGPMSVNPSAVKVQMRACALDRRQSCVCVVRPAKRIHGHLPQHRGKVILIHHDRVEAASPEIPSPPPCASLRLTYHLACPCVSPCVDHPPHLA
jgi:hypothetical protein